MNRVELLHAINEWCAGVFNPLISFPDVNGYPNVVYLFDKNNREMLEDAELLIQHIQKRLKQPVMVFIEPFDNAPKAALTYRQWIEAGDKMKAIDLKTSEQVYVMPVYDDNGSIAKYVSSNKSYNPTDLKLFDNQL